MRQFGLIGFPLSHSFSKRFFTEKFEREGLTDCRYDLYPLQSIEELPGLLKKIPALEGLNVTIPCKKQVLPFLNDREGIPSSLDACNCIRIRDGKLTGYNTDIFGFRQSLQPLLQSHHQKALVLGNGGASAAVIHVLRQLKIEFELLSRQLHTGSTCRYSDLTKEMTESHTLIINTTPLGMHPDTESCPDIPYQYLSSKHLLYDLVYNPGITSFMQKGMQKGATVKNGEEMLILQAEESWRIWNSV